MELGKKEVLRGERTQQVRYAFLRAVVEYRCTRTSADALGISGVPPNFADVNNPLSRRSVLFSPIPSELYRVLLSH